MVLSIFPNICLSYTCDENIYQPMHVKVKVEYMHQKRKVRKGVHMNSHMTR